MIKQLSLLILSSFLLVACGTKPEGLLDNSNKVVDFSSDDTTVAQVTPVVMTLPSSDITYTFTKKLNEEFKVEFKTSKPDGLGQAQFKVKSFKEITSAGDQKPSSGKKIYLAEIAVRGYASNKGQPATFNQLGDYPSPQFVIANPSTKTVTPETTYFSDAYTLDKGLFELSKLTLDGEQWVNTAIVFELDATITPDLAFRFVNSKNQVEFYDIAQ